MPNGASASSPTLRPRRYVGLTDKRINPIPKRLWRAIVGHNRVAVEIFVGLVTQGSVPRCGATLGFGTESRWDSFFTFTTLSHIRQTPPPFSLALPGLSGRL